MSMSDKTIERATEITVAALGPSTTTQIPYADNVAEFFEKIARKIEQLTTEPNKRQGEY